MPVEIRELIIKTQISTSEANQHAGISAEDVKQLKKQLLAECKKMITERTKRSNNAR
ncbi:DUF5908 family protein [Pedobacter jeongneungensis]|uniref:DUF5908 family protein n=1 Tax=Pedobacter jeongneungensis TaxID=947309 RepID=UPI000AF152AC|nr:DUF5908 family protein [Pedobacter jeongneungensis]